MTYAFPLRTEDHRRAAIEFIRRVPCGENMVVRVGKAVVRRTLEQNSLYWVRLTAIARQLKPQDRLYAPETWHEYFKAQFLGKDTIIIDGSPLLIAKTTTRLNIMEFSEYVTKVEVWAVERGVNFDEVSHGEDEAAGA